MLNKGTGVSAIKRRRVRVLGVCSDCKVVEVSQQGRPV